MNKANQDLKAYARSKKVAYWQIAKAFNVHENTFAKKLREELPQEEKEKIMKIIDEIAEKQKGEHKVKKIKKIEHSKEWHEQRSKGIGGSDAGAVCGLNKYKSRYTLWCEKTGRISSVIPDNERMRIGRDLEDYVAGRFAEATGLKTKKTNYSYQSEKYPFMLANIDRWVSGVKDEKGNHKRIGLEIKTMNEWAAKNYGIAEGYVPETYYAQCYHYMAVTGADGWYMAILVLGQYFEVFYIERDEDEIESLIAQEKDFWDMVENDIEPEPDGSASTSDTLNVLYPSSQEASDIELLRSKEAERYRIVCESLKELKEEKDELENTFKKDMQDAEKAHCNDLVISWKSNISSRLDQTKLKKEMPDVYEAYLKPSQSRRFTAKFIN